MKHDWVDKCAVCGRRDTLNSHHVIRRIYEATRYLLRNGIVLCSNHHQFSPELSPHGGEIGWKIWLDDNNPELAEWARETLDTWGHHKFDGTTNAAYFIDVIQGFREYVPDDEFDDIVGLKFGQYLETLQEETR